MLAVPMAVGDQLLGVITLSMLGYAKFDEEDQRLLEVLASHAAVAFQNAKLFQAEREAAETSTALLRLSQTLTQLHSIDDIMQVAIDTVPHLVAASGLAAYLRDEETGELRHLSHRRCTPPRRRTALAAPSRDTRRPHTRSSPCTRPRHHTRRRGDHP
jgi:GAF domain-containing protein